jgi:hypothetical protein
VKEHHFYSFTREISRVQKEGGIRRALATAGQLEHSSTPKFEWPDNTLNAYKYRLNFRQFYT